MARNYVGNEDICSGTYTPTVTDLSSNLASHTPYICQWIKVGKVVTVSGEIGVTTTTTSFCNVGVSLPIPATLIHHSRCAGVGSTGSSEVRIRSNTTNNVAEFYVNGATTSTQFILFSFTYSAD